MIGIENALDVCRPLPPALVKPCVPAECPEGGNDINPVFRTGTTGLFAKQLGRKRIGIEINPEYADMARMRFEGSSNPFYNQ